ncbi:MAG TPA: hypothetical protein DCZ10_09675 [Pelotomaculum sp.]|nr:hypothetical protein [Pelotomaculum sp.]
MFAVLILVLTLLSAYSYANETGAGNSTNMMNMPGHDMSGHTMEKQDSNIAGQSPDVAGTQQTTGNIPDQAVTPAPDGTNMAGHNMGGNGSDTAANQTSGQSMEMSGQNPQADDTTDTSAGDMSGHNMNGMSHEVPAEQPAHDMMNMPDHSGAAVQDSNDHQSMGHDGATGLNPSAKEVNRAVLLGGFGLVAGLIVLAAVILKRKAKVGGPV